MPMLSLWKAADGGRSFKQVQYALGLAGIAVVKSTERSRFEGRYDVWVSDANVEQAKALLFLDVDVNGRPTQVQALDELHDPTS